MKKEKDNIKLKILLEVFFFKFCIADLINDLINQSSIEVTSKNTQFIYNA